MVVEIPPIKPDIEEHRLHQLVCSHCGHKTRASLPEEVETSGYSRESGSDRLTLEWDVSSLTSDGGFSHV